MASSKEWRGRVDSNAELFEAAAAAEAVAAARSSVSGRGSVSGPEASNVAQRSVGFVPGRGSVVGRGSVGGRDTIVGRGSVLGRDSLYGDEQRPRTGSDAQRRRARITVSSVVRGAGVDETGGEDDEDDEERWLHSQTRAFTGWINMKLDEREKGGRADGDRRRRVADHGTDLADGEILCDLVAELTGQSTWVCMRGIRRECALTSAFQAAGGFTAARTRRSLCWRTSARPLA